MKKLIYLLVLTLSCYTIHAQNQRTFPIDAMLKKISTTKDTVTVLTFWSVWFDESKQALNEYDKLNSIYAGKNLIVAFCNLDFNYNQDTLVKPFLQKQGFKSKLWHVSESDPDKWKSKFDNSWTGDFPVAAAYYNGKKIYFHEGAPDMNALKQSIEPYLK